MEQDYEEAVNLFQLTNSKPHLLISSNAYLELQTHLPSALGLSDYRSNFKGHQSTKSVKMQHRQSWLCLCRAPITQLFKFDQRH